MNGGVLTMLEATVLHVDLDPLCLHIAAIYTAIQYFINKWDLPWIGFWTPG